MFKTSNQNNIEAEQQFRTSSHVNLFEITEYNTCKAAKRQRPQTGKLNQTTAVQISQSNQQYKLSGNAPSQFNNAQTRRLTSAKGDSRFRTKPGPDSGLANTRDVIQSFGHLTTMAGSNYDALSTNVRARKSMVTNPNTMVPNHPIIKQHFQPDPASKRLLSAKPPISRNNVPSLVVTSRPAHKQYQIRQSAATQRPKSGVVTSNRKTRPHRRAQSGKAQQQQPVQSRSIRTELMMSSDQQQYQQQVAAANNQIMLRKDIVLDANGQELVAENQALSCEPLNLAIETGTHTVDQMVPPPHMPFSVNVVQTAKSVKSGNTATNLNVSARRKQQSGNSQRASGHRNSRRVGQRSNLNHTVYRLPSLSQCIENKILPRSSEYMRRLYSIALKNHETQVPSMSTKHQIHQNNMIKEKFQSKLPENQPILSSNDGDQEKKDQDLNNVEMGLLSNTSAENIINMALNRSQANENESTTCKKKITSSRSKSLAPLHVTNLQFPFDNMIHGGFSRQKQIELNLVPLKYAEKEERSNAKKRPVTAGRMRSQHPNIDLFNNKLISQAANQLSSPNLMSSGQGQMASQSGVPAMSQKGMNSNTNDVSATIDESLSQQPHLFQVMTPTSGGVDGKQQNPQAQFANLMDRVQSGKAQIVMCVKPQESTSEDRLKEDANAYGKLLQGQRHAPSDLGQSPQRQNELILQSETDDLKKLRTPQSKGENSRSQSRTSSRNHSALESLNHKENELTNFYRRSKDYGINSLSQREFGLPLHFKEKNGTQLVVQMSGQGLTAKRLTSARPHDFKESQSQGSRSSAGTGKRRSKGGKKVPGKLSSAHSLQININKNNRQGSEQGSLNDTNKLDESDDVLIDNQGVRVMDEQRSGSLVIDSRSSRHNSQASNQDLQHLNGASKPTRQVYPIRGGKSPTIAKERYQKPRDESQAVSHHSHSQNLLETQMRLNQVYQDENKQIKQQNGQKVIHRIPLTVGSSVPTLSNQNEESSRHQVLVVTNDPNHVRQLVANQEASISNMSNPLNNLQLSTDKMQAIKVKSVAFDHKGNYQIREAERGYSVMEQYNQSPNEGGKQSPNKSPFGKSGVINQKYSPSQRHASQEFDSKFVMQEKTASDGGVVKEDSDFAHHHQKFKVTMNIKHARPNLKEDCQSVRTSKQPPIQASMKGRKMKLQVAESKHEKPLTLRQQQKLKEYQDQQQKDVHIEILNQMLDEENGIHQLDNSKGTIQNYNVPPLALPMSDNDTVMLQLSRVPSSHRGQQLSYSTNSLNRLKLMQQHQESQNILNSFNANNVRSNLKGQNAAKLIQGVDINEMTNGLIEINPNYAYQPIRRYNQNRVSSKNNPNNIGVAESIRSLERLLINAGADEQQQYHNDIHVSNQDFNATLGKDNKSLANWSASDEKLKPIQNPAQIVQQRISSAVETQNSGSSPSPLNIAENFHQQVTTAQGHHEEEVIQEIEEGSSQQSRSKISISVQSLRKLGQQSALDQQPFIKVEELPIQQSTLHKTVDKKPSTNTVKNLNSNGNNNAAARNNVVTRTSLKSVYEAEALALKRGLISAYSGKGESTIAAQKRRDQQMKQNNTDLQHFLGKDRVYKEDSVRNSVTSNRLSESISAPERQNKTRNIAKIQRTQHSADTIRSQNNKTTNSVNLRQQEQAQQYMLQQQQIVQRNSQISLTNQSSLGLNIVQFAQKKKLEERPRTSTPQEMHPTTTETADLNIQNLAGHQKKAQQVLDIAHKLMNQAKILKLDPEVINEQLMDLFKQEQDDSKDLDQMMSKATLQLGLGQQTVSPSKMVRGLEIPYQISSPTHSQNFAAMQKRKGDVASIMTKKMSSSSQHGRNDGVVSITHSFAPGSPTSSSVRHGNNKRVVSSKSGAAFNLKSVGASTNRASKWELPFFGGIISSRVGVGDLVDSSVTVRNIKDINEAVFNNSVDLSKSPSNQQNFFDLQSSQNIQKVAAPIIDYSQNFMASKSLGRKGSIQPPSKNIIKGGQTRNRPMTASRYGQQSSVNNINNNTFTELQKSSAIKVDVQQTSDTIARMKKRQQILSQDQAIIASNDIQQPKEHLQQPAWAIRGNMKSKFNMISSEEQARQAQKFMINFQNQHETKFSPDRATTAHLRTVTQTTPKQQTFSKVTKSPTYQNESSNGSMDVHKIPGEQNNGMHYLIDENNQVGLKDAYKKKMQSMPIRIEQDRRYQDENSVSSNNSGGEKKSYRVTQQSKTLKEDDISQHNKGMSFESVPIDMLTPDVPDTIQYVQKNQDQGANDGYEANQQYQNKDDEDQSQENMVRHVSDQCMQVNLSNENNSTINNQNPVSERQDNYTVNTSRILARHQNTNSDRNHQLIQEYDMHSSGGLVNSYVFDSMQANDALAMLQQTTSQKNLINSKEVIKKIPDQGYVRRSLAGDHHFSVSQINSSQRSFKKLQKQ